MHIPAAHLEWAEWTINERMVSTDRVNGPALRGRFVRRRIGLTIGCPSAGKAGGRQSAGRFCSYIVV